MKEILEIGDSCDPCNANFIQLLDCKHIFEMRYLDKWMNNENSGIVQLNKCPTCSMPIIRSFRYGRYIKEFHETVNSLKQKNRRSLAQINPGLYKKQLLDKFYKLERENCTVISVDWIRSRLQHKILEPEVLQMYQPISQLLTCLTSFLKGPTQTLVKVSGVTKYDIHTRIYTLIEWCKRDRAWLGKQELDEAYKETYRVCCILQLMLLNQTAKLEGEDLYITQITTAVENLVACKCDDSLKIKYDQFLDEMKKEFPCSNAWMYQPPSEFQASVGLIKDHWLKCSYGKLLTVTRI